MGIGPIPEYGIAEKELRDFGKQTSFVAHPDWPM